MSPIFLYGPLTTALIGCQAYRNCGAINIGLLVIVGSRGRANGIIIVQN